MPFAPQCARPRRPPRRSRAPWAWPLLLPLLPLPTAVIEEGKGKGRGISGTTRARGLLRLSRRRPLSALPGGAFSPSSRSALCGWPPSLLSLASPPSLPSARKPHQRRRRSSPPGVSGGQLPSLPRRRLPPPRAGRVRMLRLITLHIAAPAPWACVPHSSRAIAPPRPPLRLSSAGVSICQQIPANHQHVSHERLAQGALSLWASPCVSLARQGEPVGEGRACLLAGPGQQAPRERCGRKRPRKSAGGRNFFQLFSPPVLPSAFFFLSSLSLFLAPSPATAGCPVCASSLLTVAPVVF